MTQLTQNKKKLRQRMLSIRHSLAREKIIEQSILINNLCLTSKIYEKASCIMAYAAMQDEVQTDIILKDTLARGKTLCLPYITDLKKGLMKATVVNSLTDLVPGKAGILSLPANKISFIQPQAINLIIVPGVAFSLTKNRLGMGGGFYDRFLPQAKNAISVGFFFSCQESISLPINGYDVPLDTIFTEKGII
ncbi:5-formyltetrahydrofolate cyclo-ligase [Pectinatus sottacetonis]|uniref:5-formyltetrahydrofolate cyclo-ligase n=1 Tax=Pectinatus sottacetonis TaxID=1002795 RepID=UPI0018C455C4|nr:5-formyltetrahydrofolate cyclo-ligase [Pectinatus sottacetonis]